jgi:aminopeptidase
MTMHPPDIEKYADLLVNYCCNITPGQRVLIRSTPLAEPLVLACQKAVLKNGATCEFDIALNGAQRQFYDYASQDALVKEPLLYAHAVAHVDACIIIHAPYDLFELKGVSDEKIATHAASRNALKHLKMTRGATGDLKWVICNYPTQSLADAAKMTLSAYASFIAHACFLAHDHPNTQWGALSEMQAGLVVRFNAARTIQFKSDGTDISFDIHDRKWINSDGKRNMPSGEIFTSPHESSGNGFITFDIPSLLFGQEVQGLSLTICDGIVTHWQAKKGQELLNRVFQIDGANRIGEIAIGTNKEITHHTFNTLYDEKMGGTIHMAIGASYPETGGENRSSIHHDFVCRFTDKSSILLDGELCYENGTFLV